MTDDADGHGGRDGDAEGSGAAVLDPRAVSGHAAGEHDAVRDALDATAADGERRVLVWRPRRQVAFGRRDEHRDGYDGARGAAVDAGYPATRRTAGGHAVVHDGGTVAVAVAVPVAPGEIAIGDRYCGVVDAVGDALDDLGASVEDGEPDGAFCPGDHGLAGENGGKLVGVAQRVRRDAALVSGVVNVAMSPAAVALYRAVYGHLDVPFEPGSLADLSDAAPSDVDAAAVADALRRRLAE